MSNNNGDSNPFTRTMPLALTIRMLGDSRKVANTQVEVDTDKDMLRVSKKIFDCEEYKAVQSAAGEIRSYLARKKVPGGEKLFRSGTYPIAISMLEEVDEKLGVLTNRFNVLVDSFCTVYEQRKQEAMTRLKDLANEGDYPPLRKVKQEFGVNYQYVSFGPPSSLAGLSEEIYKREVKKIEENCALAAEEVKLALRSAFLDLLEHMTDRLKPGEDGKKKIFKDSLVTNLRNFLDDFSAKNITNDDECQALVDKCRATLNGKTPDKLRKDESVREITEKALSSIKSDLEGKITNMKMRQINLED